MPGEGDAIWIERGRRIILDAAAHELRSTLCTRSHPATERGMSASRSYTGPAAPRRSSGMTWSTRRTRSDDRLRKSSRAAEQ